MDRKSQLAIHDRRHDDHDVAFGANGPALTIDQPMHADSSAPINFAEQPVIQFTSADSPGNRL